ncbi:MAG: methyltransferase domain-containing protein [Spirochaetales bacterium]|jgi:arsenite methyltransferase|nr:methyltransferase domain-containing protein [Spirochaetales bacterium]
MSDNDTIKAIDVRYSELAEESCCLSCGGAVKHSDPQKGEVCIDLGSGRGTDVIRMAEEVGSEGHVYGIDVSDGMLEKAKKTALKLDVSNVSFLKAELNALPVEDETADLIISNCTINHADDKQGVWDEVYRALKKGGRFVVSDIYSTDPVPEEYRTDPQAVAECWAGSITRDEYIMQIADAGFNDMQILEESEPYEKGSIKVVSWTIYGTKPKGCGCGCSCS